MQVIEFIKQNGLDALTEKFAISVKKVDDLLVLNYNQIDSPKTDPIVMECRSLILEAETLKVVSRSFDRFFNYGEGGKIWERDKVAIDTMEMIDWSRAVAFEKVDGSLIKIYNHKGHWYISTKGTAYGESDCMGYGVTFFELVLKALGCKDDADFQSKCRFADLFPEYTYIYELTSVENRVVKRYDGYKLHYLATRVNYTGHYVTESERHPALDIGAYEPDEYVFDSAEECLKHARELKNLDEGFVIYQDGVPIAKIKSPAYVAVHHIRGEGLNPKRIMQLVLVNEQDEYLTYFPEDRDVFVPYIKAMEMLDIHMDCVYDALRGIEDQKEFALGAKNFSFSAALFKARAAKITVAEAFATQRDVYQMEILMGYVK
jgi:T4 RnlA family RNA ligase